jgi:predicted ester cyclase
VAFDVIDILRLAEGKLVEHWAVSDMLALMSQLGAIPEPEGVGI